MPASLLGERVCGPLLYDIRITVIQSRGAPLPVMTHGRQMCTLVQTKPWLNLSQLCYLIKNF
jgi:hypothetical protein